MKANVTGGKSGKTYLIRLSRWITEQGIGKMAKEQSLLSTIKDRNFWRPRYRPFYEGTWHIEVPHIYKTYIASNDYVLYPVFIGFRTIP